MEPKPTLGVRTSALLSCHTFFRFVSSFTDTDGTKTLATFSSTIFIATKLLIDCLCPLLKRSDHVSVL